MPRVESRRRRFFTPISESSEADLDYLTNVDHHDHEAIVVVGIDESVDVRAAVHGAAEITVALNARVHCGRCDVLVVRAQDGAKREAP